MKGSRQVKRHYFDNNATTAVSAEVISAMLPCLAEVYGNASSIHHYGQQAKQLLESARREIAALLGCSAKEIVLLSGGTEADNLAIFGAVGASPRARKHVVTTTIEHPAVLNACAELERRGVAVTYVKPLQCGVVTVEEIRRALRPETVLVSVMHANNETGVVQPVAEIASAAREAGVCMHSDGVQAAGKLPLNTAALGVDLYSISGHKLYAPKGIGALYVRTGIELRPVLFGGRHESGRRAGTENVAGAVALGRAARWCLDHGEAETARLVRLRDRLEQRLLDALPDVSVNGRNAPRLPNTSSITFQGVQGEALLIALDLRGFAVSSGAACSSGAVEPSHVLLALGLTREQAQSTLRISLGRSNDEADTDALVEALRESVERLRRLSPAYA
jgi:cysteine desulfurase